MYKVKILLKIYTIGYMQWMCNYMQDLRKVMRIVVCFGFYGMMSSSSTIVLGNMVCVFVEVVSGVCVG